MVDSPRSLISTRTIDVFERWDNGQEDIGQNQLRSKCFQFNQLHAKIFPFSFIDCRVYSIDSFKWSAICPNRSIYYYTGNPQLVLVVLIPKTHYFPKSQTLVRVGIFTRVCTFHNTYEYLWLHKRDINLNFSVLCIGWGVWLWSCIDWWLWCTRWGEGKLQYWRRQFKHGKDVIIGMELMHCRLKMIHMKMWSCKGSFEMPWMF